jgi:hypothetical protein
VSVWVGDDPFTGIAPWGTEVHLVGPVGDVLLHVVVDGTGAELLREERGAAASTNPALRATPSGLWLVERSTGSEQLATFPDRIPVGASAEKVLGPVDLDGRTWVALDGLLHEVVALSVAAGPDRRPIDCLDAVGGVGWACSGGLLYPLTSDGTLGDPIVGPADVGPPDLDLSDEEDVALCFSEWRVWAGDAGVDPGPGPEEEHPDEPLPLVLAEDGCGCDSDGGSALGALLAPWLFRRRRWFRPSCSCPPSCFPKPGRRPCACSRRFPTPSIRRPATGTVATRTTSA